MSITSCMKKVRLILLSCSFHHCKKFLCNLDVICVENKINNRSISFITAVKKHFIFNISVLKLS